MINFNTATTPAKNRIFGFKFGDFFIEICRVLKKFADNDIDNALIIYVVANAAMQDVVESGMHTEAISDSDLIRLLSARGVNISTVANTTGIDRATARRKLKNWKSLVSFCARKTAHLSSSPVLSPTTAMSKHCSRHNGWHCAN